MTKIQDVQDEIHRKTRELEDLRDEIKILKESNEKYTTKIQDLQDEIRRKTRAFEDLRDEMKVLRHSNVRKEMMSDKVVDRKIVQNKLQNLRLETKELRDTIVSQRKDMMEMMST